MEVHLQKQIRTHYQHQRYLDGSAQANYEDDKIHLKTDFSHCHKISTDHVSNLIITLCGYDANTVLPVSMGRQDYIINNNYCSF